MWHWPLDHPRFFAPTRPLPPLPSRSRFYWYAAHFLPDTPLVWILPQNWNWDSAQTPAMDVWVYSNAAAVELFLNGASLGKQTMTQYGVRGARGARGAGACAAPAAAACARGSQ